MHEVTEKVGKDIWDALLKEGGKGRTLMPWESSPEREWCLETAQLAISKFLEYAATDSDAAEWCENAFRNYLVKWE